MPDWIDSLIKIITFVLAFYGVLAAVAAKRSALAAENQAILAETQAKAAVAQASSAELQVEQMNYQGAIAARAVILSKIDIYNTEIALIEQIASEAGAIASHAEHVNVEDARNQARLEFYDRLGTNADALRVCVPTLGKYTDSEPGFADRTSLRRRLLHAAEQLGHDAATLAARLRMHVMADNFPREEIERSGAAVADAAGRTDGIGLVLRRDLEEAMTQLWARVHRLEMAVIEGRDI